MGNIDIFVATHALGHIYIYNLIKLIKITVGASKRCTSYTSAVGKNVTNAFSSALET